jgi:pimeloyl-ACP methyl ester carboxylesterase
MSRANSARRKKSTNDRFQVRAARAGFRLLEATAPALGAAWAERIFFRPPPSRLSPRLQALLASATSFAVPFRDQSLAAWRWGDGPRVILVHGWGSRGGHLGAFVAPLLAAGFSVVTFDGPAHGASPGQHTTIPEMAAALWAVAGTAPTAGVVAHSAGGVAAAYALRHGFTLGRAVLLAPAARPDTYAERFAFRLALGPRTQAGLRARSETRVGVPWSALDVAAFAGRMEVPLLIVHDERDEEVPQRDGAEIAAAWPGSTLLTTIGLGHHQVLRDPGVVGRAVEFLAANRAGGDVERQEVLYANG